MLIAGWKAARRQRAVGGAGLTTRLEIKVDVTLTASDFGWQAPDGSWIHANQGNAAPGGMTVYKDSNAVWPTLNAHIFKQTVYCVACQVAGKNRM